jgi:hypothetical protein
MMSVLPIVCVSVIHTVLFYSDFQQTVRLLTLLQPVLLFYCFSCPSATTEKRLLSSVEIICHTA